MFITDLFSFKTKCRHEKITPDMESGYCPDCGKLIKNEWYITRCACCGVKLKTFERQGEIVPQNHYCTNCGSDDFIVEKLEKINFVDINFAALKKVEVEPDSNIPKTTRCWQERTSVPLGLPVKYL